MSNEIAVKLSLETANALQKMSDFLSKAGIGLQDLALEVTALSASMEGLHKLEEAVVEAVKLEEAVGRLQQRTGLSVPTIEALREASNAVGLEFNDLGHSLTNFNAKIYDAVTDGGKAMEMFRTLGVELRNADGSLRSADSILLETVESFKKLNSVQQDAIAKGLFGKAGYELIPMFQQLGEAIDHVQAKGSPITQQSADAAMQFNMSLRELHESLESVFLVAASSMLPTMAKLAAGLKDASEQTNVLHNVSEIASVTLKIMASSVIQTAVGAYELGKAFMVAGGIIDTAFRIAMEGVVALTKQSVQVIGDLMQMIIDLDRSLATAAQVGYELLHGNISAAKDLVKGELSEITDHGKKLVADVGSFVSSGTSTVMSGLSKLFAEADAMFSNFKSGMLSDLAGSAKLIGEMWSGASSPHAATPPFFPSSTESVKSLKDLDTIMQELWKQQQRLIESDPFSTQLQKMQQLLPLIEQQKQLVTEQYAAQYAVYSNPATSDANKTASLKELVKLQGQLNDLMIQANHLVTSQGFMNNLRRQAVQLANQWQDLGKSLAEGSFRIIQQGVQGIADALTGLIMGTANAGQAFTQLGVRMLESFISMILTAVIEAYAAIPILTALGVLSGGATAAQGSAVTTAAVVGAMSTVGGLVGREYGGPVSAGQAYIVGERQPELFVPNQNGFIHPSVLAGGGGGNLNNFHIHPARDQAGIAREVLLNPEATHIVVDMINANRTKIIPRKF